MQKQIRRGCILAADGGQAFKAVAAALQKPLSLLPGVRHGKTERSCSRPQPSCRALLWTKQCQLCQELFTQRGMSKHGTSSRKRVVVSALIAQP